MLSPEQRLAYIRDGFIVLPSVVGEDWLARLRETTDEFIEQFKGMAPVCSFDERKEVLESCRHVDAVIPNIGGTDSKPAILQARPDVVAIGSDWAPPRDYHAQMMFTAEWLEEQQIRLVFLNRTEGVSSSELRDRSTRQQDNQLNTTTS